MREESWLAGRICSEGATGHRALKETTIMKLK